MSDSENESKEEPKLVVDTDWKEQVAREKELASQPDATGRSRGCDHDRRQRFQLEG